MRRVVIFSVSGILLVALASVFLGRQPARSQAAAAAELVIFSGKNFTGRRLVLTQSAPDLPAKLESDGVTRFSWNDNVKSMIVVKGTWRVFAHGRLNTVIDDTPIEEFNAALKQPLAGWSCLVSAKDDGPVEMPDAESGGWGEDISSIALVSGSNLPSWALLQQ